MKSRVFNKNVWPPILNAAELMVKGTVIAVPLLYFLGWVYAESFWATVGLNDGLFSYTTTEAMRMGFLVFAKFSTGVAGTLVVSAILMLFAAAALQISRRRIARHLHERAQKRTDEPSKQPPLENEDGELASAQRIVRTSDRMAVLAALLFILGTGFLVALVGSIKLTQDAAEEHAKEGMQRLKNFQTANYVWTLAHVAGDSGNPSIVVRCSDAACALYTGHELRVVSRDAIERLVPCSKPSVSKEGVTRCEKPFLGS